MWLSSKYLIRIDTVSGTISNKQIKLKNWVANYGEVFTGEREVNAMLDLIKQETERIESRFPESAYSNGNFLTEILWRKLAVTGERYSGNKIANESHLPIIVASIYGADCKIT